MSRIVSLASYSHVVSRLNGSLADLKATFQLQILGVKKNPQSPMYTQLGVLTKGTIIEVNVSELGMVTAGGKVVFGKYAQITNNPENDGCINAVLCESLLLENVSTPLIIVPQWYNLFIAFFSRTSCIICILVLMYTRYLSSSTRIARFAHVLP